MISVVNVPVQIGDNIILVAVFPVQAALLNFQNLI